MHDGFANHSVVLDEILETGCYEVEGLYRIAVPTVCSLRTLKCRNVSIAERILAVVGCHVI